MKRRLIFKRLLTLVLVVMMLVTTVPVSLFAEPGAGGTQDDSKFLADDYSITYNDKIIRKADYINKVDNLPIEPVKTKNAETLITNPAQPDRYTVRADFKVERGDDYVISYQPYIATVGAAASDEEKAKVDKELKFPEFDGYTSATKKTTVDYNFVKKKAENGKEIPDPDLGTEKKGPYEAIYKPVDGSVLVKHVFQKFDDPEVYKEKPGDPEGYFRETTQTGLTGTSLKIQPLPDHEIEGYVPESNDIKTQVPENPKGFVVEFRYNRASYDLVYDTDGGTPIPSRRVYYKQVIPKLSKNEIPSKDGCEFIGWKASHDIEDTNGNKFKAGDTIKDATDKPIKNLDANLLVPALKAKNNNRSAEKLIFTAVWKDKEKADYAVQFWVEKADHDDNATIAQKYDYMGTRVYKDADTGKRPDLAAEPVNGLKFPDLDQARLNKIWANARFNRKKDLYLNKFFVYNKALTDKENADSKNVNLVKAVNANGKTVYNIYYDRQVYDLYFTKSNAQPEENTFYPEIYGYDPAKGESVMLGGPGNPYHYKARFNEMMYKWPNDAKQTKGFTPGYQSFGWGPNYVEANWPVHLDTPPYRLNADQFLDMANYTTWGGYTKNIDKGDGTTMDLDKFDFTTLSFGIKQDKPSIPHHMDFWMDGFKDKETIIRYDLVRTKADTGSLKYEHKYPKVLGFTPYGYNPKEAWPSIREDQQEDGRVDEDRIDELNDERDGITLNTSGTYYNNYGTKLPIGQLDFIPVFFSDADEYGDPKEDDEGEVIVPVFKENGYLQFHYKRNKYPLRFNYDPSITRDDSYFSSTNKLDTFYEFPLKVLSPDLVDNKIPQAKREYFKDNPANLLDNPNNLYKLGLYDLLEVDKNKLDKLSDANKEEYKKGTLDKAIYDSILLKVKEKIKLKNEASGKEEEKEIETYKVKRPEGLSPQMEFKGWALDPAGTKLIWENSHEKMPSHPANLFAKWAEPDYKWKITFDPNGGKMPDLKTQDIVSKQKTIKEGDIGFEREVTYPLAGYKNEDGTEIEATVDGKKIFTVIQRQKLVPPEIPIRKGYEFMGWELVRYEKDDDGNLKLDSNNKPIEDKSYRNDFKVPELYSFDNDVVSDLYLRAIWNKNDLIDIKAYHHFLDKDYKEVSRQEQVLQNRRVGSYVGAVGSRQNAERILVPKDEWKDLEEKNETNTDIDTDGSMTYRDYTRFDPVNPRVNSYYQQIIVKPEKIQDPAHPDDPTQLIDNPEVKYNVFHYYYRPFRHREYKVNYLDVRAKDSIETILKINNLEEEIKKLDEQIKRTRSANEKQKLTKAKNAKNDELTELNKKKPSLSLETIIKEHTIIDKETVINGNRDFDARNYRHIPGWVLADGEKPQQQLFFDINEETNELLGINGTGSDEIYFFYKDVRVIEVPGDKEPPTGYVRVTFKADKGGSFGKDDKGNDIKELHYDVIKGFRSDNLLVPQVLKNGEEKDSKKYYITPDNVKNFVEWTDSKLLNSDTILEKNYSFTAKFDWSGLSSSGLVTTESFKDPDNIWTNNFAPSIAKLKEKLVWKVKEEEKPLPEGTEIKFFNETGEELTSDEDVFNLLEEKKAADKEELFYTVNITAKVKFKDKKDTQELNIPIKVYKNVYEALNKDGDKPLFLTEAEKDDLKDVTGNYVKVIVAPTGDMADKNNKVYYVNPKAWVEIPEVKADGSSTFINWTADKSKQNEDSKANGKFDFAKRHKFTEDTIISPRFSQIGELVVHESYKEGNNWVNDFITDELTEAKLKAAVHVKDAKGNIIALGDDDKVTIVDGEGNPYTDDAALKDDLYKKLKENNDGKVSRTENIKVKVTFENRQVQTLTVPVKVIKNIYEAKTESGRPNYVPDGYVKVTLDPTTKAKDPQKYFYYVNPNAKVQIPGKDPVGVKEAFTGWTMKADSAPADVVGTAYKLEDRHQFTEDSTITAQYGQGKVKIIYVDENKKEIDPKYHIDGEDYPEEKLGKLGAYVPDPAHNQTAEKAAAPKFKGYIISSVTLNTKPANYTDPATATITYQYNKKVTTDDKSTSLAHFPVVFDANTGTFADGKTKVTVYVYCDGSGKTPEPVNFEEVRQAIEEKYGKPSKANENFIEWQNAATNGSRVDEAYVIKLKNSNNWDDAEVFYAHYGKASALIKYLDLDGKPIADEFKIDGVDYPTEKDGTADEAIKSDVFTKDTAPKFIGYKFNRIELNPKDGKYSLNDKATIKIYYEKDSDVIPSTGNEKPEGYVEVKFVPTNNAKDTAEKTFYVNPKKDVIIPIANPVAKATFTFKEWKMGANTDGDAYNPKTPHKFTDPTTVITATYTSSENIIPYDPSETDPMTRPEGYVRVSFAADNGLTLTNVKHYYVKANKGITLADPELAKPTVTAETGYKFDNKWDKEDSFVIADQDVLVNAKAIELPDYVEKTNENPNKPDDKYVTVTFKAGENGTATEKTYFVNPNKYVHLTPPGDAKGNTGYEFNNWSSNKHSGEFSLANHIKFDEDTIITANFNQKGSVVPIEGLETKRPEGYVKVTFEIEGTGGIILNDQVTSYYVDPEREVNLRAPITASFIGYDFDKWYTKDGDPQVKSEIFPANGNKYKKDTTIYGSFKILEGIIPRTNNAGVDNEKPYGYVTVTFLKGEHGNKISGETVYYVNPEANPKKRLSEITDTNDARKPTVTPDTGYVFKGWDTADTEITMDMIITATYDELPHAVEKTNQNPNRPDPKYVTVTFRAEDGAKGTIKEKVYFVNPEKYVKLTPPSGSDIKPNAGFEFSAWSMDVSNYTIYEQDTVITGSFRPQKTVYPKINDTDKPPTNDFVTVKFVLEKVEGEDAATIRGNEVVTYFVKKDTLVTLDPPSMDIKTGYKFENWTTDATKPNKYTGDTTIIGRFSKHDDIISAKNPDGTVNAKPEGYVIVNFLKGDHGILDGQTTYYVNPDANKTLGQLKSPKVDPSHAYKFKEWNKTDETLIKTDLEVTAIYEKQADIIPQSEEQKTAPEGYVVVIFQTDNNGKLEGNKDQLVYFVNPLENIKLVDDANQTGLKVPATSPNKNYEFDTWFDKIDYENPITVGRVYVAKFKTKEVTLSYEANDADDSTLIPDSVTVPYNTKVRLANQGNLKKMDAKFVGWKIGDSTYQVGTEVTLIADTEAVAQWEDDKKIIEYNPVDNPTTRPDDTYVRVTFATDDGLKLTEQKAYYVKKGTKLADIKNDNNYGYPSVSPKTGYKFDNWDEGNTIEINSDTIVTAKSTKLDTVIPEKNEHGIANDKPEGYKEVVFVVKAEDAAKGSLDGVTKFYVNPNEYVTINPPTTKANTGFEFGAWDKDTRIPTVYTDDETLIEGSFNGLKDVIPKTKTDESEKPDGYKTVTFVIEGQGGSIVDGEVTVYFVNPEKEVKINPPQTLAETGYEFDKWDKDTVTVAKKYDADLTVKGNFKKLDDIVDGSKPKPDGYVKVTFISETNGRLRDGDKKVYYVNPSSKTLGDLTKPDLIPDIGFEKDSWDILGVGAYDGRMSISEDMIINAKYKPLEDVVPKTTNDDSERPTGYIEVTFKTTDKAGNVEKTIYINPNKALKLEGQAPEVNPMTGYQFAGWSRPVKEKVQYNGGDVITAQFNKIGDVLPQENTDGSDKPTGYLTVTFDKGVYGKELTGKTVYYVKPNIEVTVPAPKVTAETGYKFTSWNKELTQTFKSDTSITAQFNKIGDVLPQENTDGSDKPDGYITITFVKGDHGELSGQTVQYVKPNTLVTVPQPTVTADLGYKFDKWDTPLQNIFTNNTTITAIYDTIPDVLPQKDPDGSEQPVGYVRVKFIPTDKATDKTEKVYYVNPSKEVTITEKPTGTKVTDANDVSYDYTFTGWTVTRGTINSWPGPSVSDKFIQDTVITAKYSVTIGNIMPLPLAKDNAVTAKRVVPKAEDLIKNIPGTTTNPLPNGTTFKYTDDGTPDVNNPGKTTAKVEVKYPNGKTSIVEVPITVVDYVVEQFGNDKPLVPETYVEVIVDTTDNATENTRYKKTFWVKPEVEVTIPAQVPTGKEITENGVRKTNNFTKWLSDNNKEYTGTIRDKFSRTVEITKITAQYEFNKNIDPKGNNGMYLPQNSTPSAKDFIKNVYNDSEPNNKVNLPPGTRFEFAHGNPDTSEEGKGKTTTIKVTYPNGEVKEVNVSYNVSGDVVEQRPGEAKPDYVPNDYIQVIVTTKETVEKVSDPADPMPPVPSTEEVERATEETRFTKTFWVKPNVEVTLDVNGSTIEGIIDDTDHRQWIFDHWQETGYDTRYGSDDIRGIFSERMQNVPIYIEAKYRKDDVPVPSADYVVTEVGVYPSEQQYRDVITAPDNKVINSIEVIDRPDVSKPGLTKAKIKVTYTDGTQAEVVVMVYVKERYEPSPSEPQIIYRDRIIEREKIRYVEVDKSAKYLEVAYMQGNEGKFMPYKSLSRAEAAQILANALVADGYDYIDIDPSAYYSDIDSNAWYKKAVSIVTQAGVFEGFEGKFMPDRPITQGEWIATLTRFQMQGSMKGNAMRVKEDHWAKAEVQSAYAVGWLKIYTDGTMPFDVDKAITREEVAAVTNRAFNRVRDFGYESLNDDHMYNFKDIDRNMWSYFDILCATNTSVHNNNSYLSHEIDYRKYTADYHYEDLTRDHFQRVLRQNHN